MKKVGIATAVALAAIGLLTGQAANATDASAYTQQDLPAEQKQPITEGQPIDPIAAIETAAPEVLDDVAGAFAANAIDVPTDASVGISLETADGDVLGIGLPNADDADAAVVEAEGVVSYDNGDGSTTVPVVKEDGSVQINMVIADSTAPTRYEYALDIPAGATLAEVGDQMFAVLSAEGEPQTVILPPWAKDAAGADIPTRYAVENGSLVQYVDHRRAGVSYPVVADPQFAWYGVLPSIKTTRNETAGLRNAGTPTGIALCTRLGSSVGLAIGVLCGLNAASIAWNAGLAYSAGKCSQLLIGPGVIGTVAYKDSYCR